MLARKLFSCSYEEGGCSDCMPGFREKAVPFYTVVMERKGRTEGEGSRRWPVTKGLTGHGTFSHTLSSFLIIPLRKVVFITFSEEETGNSHVLRRNTNAQQAAEAPCLLSPRRHLGPCTTSHTSLSDRSYFWNLVSQWEK